MLRFISGAHDLVMARHPSVAASLLPPRSPLSVDSPTCALDPSQVGHLAESPLFERLSNDALRADPTIPALIRTDEGLKVRAWPAPARARSRVPRVATCTACTVRAAARTRVLQVRHATLSLRDRFVGHIQVTRNNGNMYIAAFRKRLDPPAPPAPPMPNDNVLAAAAAADAGYTPKAGGEKRGMTW